MSERKRREFGRRIEKERKRLSQREGEREKESERESVSVSVSMSLSERTCEYGNERDEYLLLDHLHLLRLRRHSVTHQASAVQSQIAPRRSAMRAASYRFETFFIFFPSSNYQSKRARSSTG